MTEEQIGNKTPHACTVRVPPWVWFFLSLLAGIGLQRFVPISFPVQLDSLIGWVVVSVGMALLAWSERQFTLQRTSHDHKEVASTLITTGPFRFSRNPVYLGLLILLVGLAMALNTLWILFFMPLVMLIMQFHVVPKEEACLQKLFPDA